MGWREGRVGGSAEIPAHSLIMSAASPYVLSKLTRWRDEQEETSASSSSSSSSSSPSSSSSSSSAPPSTTADDETKTITITIPELDAAALAAAVHFAYTGTVALDPACKDDALPLIAGFQLLDMEDAVETVAEWVGSTLDPTTALRVRHTAESLHMGVLKARAEVYIDTHFEAVTKTEEWQMLPAKDVEEVLTRDELRPHGEINVFHALVRWARGGGGSGESKGGDGREAQFVDLLGRCVRASRLGTHDLSVVVLGEPLVDNSATAMRAMMRVLRERGARSSHSSQFASPEPLCRRRADKVPKIFAVGGRDESTRFNTVECFDPLTREWSAVTAMSTARSGPSVAVLAGKLYAIGGKNNFGNTISTVECFDPATEEWSLVAPTNTARNTCGAGVMDGKLYTVGGWDDDAGDEGMALRSVECFDPSTGQWSAVAPMNSVRDGAAVATVGGKLYAVGGAGGPLDGDVAFLSSAECFDSSTGLWSPIAAMSTARCYHDVAMLAGKLYAVGGSSEDDEDDDALSAVECFDPSTGQWSPVADMGAARNSTGVSVSDGKLYAVGGHDGANNLSSIESFDPATGQWSSMGNMSIARRFPGVAAMEYERDL